MISAKCFLLLLFAEMVGAFYKPVRLAGLCTARTYWQKSTVKDFHNDVLNKKNMNFDCTCAERAEGIAWVATINGTTDEYRHIYDVYTTRLVGRPLWNQYHQVQCMLDKLRNQEDLKSKVIDGRTYGCAYTRTPEEPQMADNVSQALTCVYLREGRTCQ